MAPTSRSDTKFALDYAATAGLNRFIICDGSEAVEYENASDAKPPCYKPSGRHATLQSAASGRWRIALPPQRGGHVVTTWPDLLISVRLSLDLLKLGYFHVHFISTAGAAQERSTFGLLLSNLAARGRRLTVMLARLLRARPLAWTFIAMARSRAPAYQAIGNRVLMIIPSFARGGTERQMLITAEALSRRGYQVCMLALRPLHSGEPNYEDEIARSGIEARIAPAELNRHPRPRRMIARPLRQYADNLPLWLLDFADGVARTIEDFRPVVVHCWLDQAAVIGGLTANVLGVPHVVANQVNVVAPDSGQKELKLYRDGYLALARNPAAVLVNNSTAGAINYGDWLGFKRGRIRVLPNIFLPATVRIPLPDEVSAFRASHGLRTGDPVVGTMIRFVPQKDPELWLDAAAIIAAARPGVRFLLAGYGPLEAAIRRKIGELGLGDHVVMPGAVTDVGLVYAAIDVFMLSSRYEGLPYALIEAQAAGRPVVATDVGGNSEGFADGTTGNLVRDRSPQTLADAVISILNNTAWMERAKIEGPAFVQRHFGLDQVVDRTLEIYGLPRFASG
jgi:glycosyltransferase involved in cell wall biosynthesis